MTEADTPGTNRHDDPPLPRPRSRPADALPAGPELQAGRPGSPRAVRPRPAPRERRADRVLPVALRRGRRPPAGDRPEAVGHGRELAAQPDAPGRPERAAAGGLRAAV